jgi:uncharacterized protein with PIN domain
VSRILKAYEAQFRAALNHVRARRLDQGVQWLVAKAQRVKCDEGISISRALARIHEDLAKRTRFHRADGSTSPIRFLCDAGLGGLARWLRVSGHEALWRQDIDDDDLLVEARKAGVTILTTDSLLMERRVLRDGVLPALWVPPTLGIAGQLALVFREFGLKVGEPRCMSCGGELRRADKEALRDRIPPKTFCWLDEYFLCSRCDKLFWRGTHWERITRKLVGSLGSDQGR